MEKTNYKEALDQLRQRYQNNQVSPLIGAGFSKNVSKDMFMSWEELLFDMVVELFNNEIRQSYYNRKPIKPHSKSVYCNFKKSKVTEIIRREGYLNIVSKYIDHKGFREAVEVYIEDRTPYVDNVTNILCLPINSKTKLITDGDLAIHLELLSRNWNKIYTTNYDNLLEYAIVRYNKDYSIITKRHQLSFSRNNAIIKIHGDLESKNKSNFEFDHEYNHRYIISKEDYETYPQKHEAFTQLMRISLLQGVFCLFGFSGEDPNFIAWIKWVRDILVTAPKNLKTNDVDADNSKKEDDYKIYLITIDAKKPTPDKQLFYDNHKICIIPLLNKVVKELLEVSETDDLKAIFVKFFKFMDKQENQEDNVASESAVENNLTTDIGEEKKGQAYSIQNYPNEIDKDVIQIPPKLPSSHPPIYSGQNTNHIPDYEKHSYYLNLWSEVYHKDTRIVDLQRLTEITIKEDVVKKIHEAKPFNRLVKYSGRQKKVLSDLYSESFDQEKTSLFICALKDTFHYPQYYPGVVEEIDNIEKTEELAIEWNSLKERHNTLKVRNLNSTNLSTKIDSLYYEYLLKLMFSFQFDQLRESINRWDSKGHFLQKKAMMVAMFDRGQAKDILLKYLDSNPIMSPLEKLAF